MSEGDMTAAVVSLVVGYILGGIPFGLLIGRMKGVDVRSVGSGNIGATNLGRALGKKWGLVCLALDMAKGMLPVMFVTPILAPIMDADSLDAPRAAMALGTILGHVFTPYLMFKGGKGVATTIGAFAALLHFWILVPVAGYLIVRKGTKYVSAGSLMLAALLPVAAALRHRSELDQAWPVVALAGAATVLVIVRHASNIKRLLKGEEMAAPVIDAQADGSTSGGKQ